MTSTPAQVVFDGFRHESTCRKVLFQEPGAVCSCSSPFPIPDSKPSPSAGSLEQQALNDAAKGGK